MSSWKKAKSTGSRSPPERVALPVFAVRDGAFGSRIFRGGESVEIVCCTNKKDIKENMGRESY